MATTATLPFPAGAQAQAPPNSAVCPTRTPTKADAPEFTPLQLAILKRLLAVGSHGALTQHLYSRLPRSSAASRIAALKDLLARGLVDSGKTHRSTTKWSMLWTLTDAGTQAARAVQSTPTSSAKAS